MRLNLDNSSVLTILPSKVKERKQDVNITVTGEPGVSAQEKKSICNLKTKHTYSFLSGIPFSLYSFFYLHTHTFLVPIRSYGFPFFKLFFAPFFYLVFLHLTLSFLVNFSIT